ncbi:MAG: PAS domain S-box protein, partial [Syntrophobacterales bacterium]
MIDYRDILDSMDRGIVTVDLQGEVTSCNRALEEILEVEAKTIVGYSLEEAFTSEDPLYRLLKESIQEEARSQERDLAYTCKKGTIKPLRVTTFPLKKKTGERVGEILLVIDMTEIRKLEERVQRASRLAALGQLTQRLV